MAISHIGSNTQDSGGALSLTFTVPGATTTDDLILVFVKQSENTTQRIWDDDGGGGNGYTQAAYNRTTSGRDQETAVYWKFATSGSESNPTFTWASGVTTEPMSGIMEVYRGVDKDFFTSDLVTFLAGTNDANPPNAEAESIQFDDSWVVVNHAATHDDISTVAAPTGFTLRSQVWNGTSNDHRNNFTADISNIDKVDDPYTPPDWGHSVLNTTPEYSCYTVVLPEDQPIGVLGGTIFDGFSWGNNNLTITGKGFEATQGTGKVEIWDDTSGTTKTTQTIDSWSDTSIQIDTVQGSLPDDTVVYVVVTNDSAEESNAKPVSVGLLGYSDLIATELKADHYWRLNNTYDDTGDTGPTRDMTSGVIGTWTFNTQEIVDGNTHSLNYSSVTNRREIADSPNMNITNTHDERTICCWVQLNNIQHPLAALWKEGGGIQNLAFLIGYGNRVLAQLADTAGTRDNVQAWSDFRLAPNRPYHICMRYSNLETTAEMRLFIDGEEQTNTDGNPMTINIFDTHSGDVTWGDPDNNLETGGTDISYNTLSNAQMSDFATWSEESAGTNGGALDKTTEIRDILFRRGAIPDDIITSDTEANMQSDLDATADNRANWPLSYRIESPTGGGNLKLVLEDKVFPAETSLHLEWRGTGILTLVNSGTSNALASKCFAPAAGTISIIESSDVTITDLQNPTEVRIFEAGNEDNELAGQENVTSGTFTANIRLDIATAIDVHLISKGYINRRLENIDISGGDVGIPAQQQVDLNYENP